MTTKINGNQIQLGDDVDTSKNFIISVPATPDGTLSISRMSGESIVNIDADGVVTTAQGSVGGIHQMDAVSASGTAVDFTGIPSWVKRITVSIANLSTNGTSRSQIRLGTQMGFVASGYVSVGSTDDASNSNVTGFALPGLAASDAKTGTYTLNRVGNTNRWQAEGIFTYDGSSNATSYVGAITLPDVLTQLRITTTNGTDTFDAGTISISYEG